MLALLLRTGAGAHSPLCSVPRFGECDYSVLRYFFMPPGPNWFVRQAAPRQVRWHNKQKQTWQSGRRTASDSTPTRVISWNKHHFSRKGPRKKKNFLSQCQMKLLRKKI